MRFLRTIVGAGTESGHLGGLPDVTLLAVPDLPAIHAIRTIGAKGQIPVIERTGNLWSAPQRT